MSVTAATTATAATTELTHDPTNCESCENCNETYSLLQAMKVKHCCIGGESPRYNFAFLGSAEYPADAGYDRFFSKRVPTTVSRPYVKNVMFDFDFTCIAVTLREWIRHHPDAYCTPLEKECFVHFDIIDYIPREEMLNTLKPQRYHIVFRHTFEVGWDIYLMEDRLYRQVFRDARCPQLYFVDRPTFDEENVCDCIPRLLHDYYVEKYYADEE